MLRTVEIYQQISTTTDSPPALASTSCFSVNSESSTPARSRSCVGALPCLSSSSRFRCLSTKGVTQLDTLLCVGERKRPLYATNTRELRLFKPPVPSERSIDLAGSRGAGVEVFKLVGRWELEQDVVRPAVLVSLFQHVGHG
jgi:hypothetical protein